MQNVMQSCILEPNTRLHLKAPKSMVIALPITYRYLSSKQIRNAKLVRFSKGLNQSLTNSFDPFHQNRWNYFSIVLLLRLRQSWFENRTKCSIKQTCKIKVSSGFRVLVRWYHHHHHQWGTETENGQSSSLLCSKGFKRRDSCRSRRTRLRLHRQRTGSIPRDPRRMDSSRRGLLRHFGGHCCFPDLVSLEIWRQKLTWSGCSFLQALVFLESFDTLPKSRMREVVKMI